MRTKKKTNVREPTKKEDPYKKNKNKERGPESCFYIEIAVKLLNVALPKDKANVNGIERTATRGTIDQATAHTDWMPNFLTRHFIIFKRQR